MKASDPASHYKILRALFDFGIPRETLAKQLQTLDWDFDGPELRLELSIFLDVLQRYVSGEIVDQDLEWWANALECREDIEFPPTHAEFMEDAIYKLANPDLHPEPIAVLAKQILDEGMRK